MDQTINLGIFSPSSTALAAFVRQPRVLHSLRTAARMNFHDSHAHYAFETGKECVSITAYGNI
jgi:hypothetical protein